VGSSVSAAGARESDDDNLCIQMGVDSGSGMYLFLVDASTKGIGLSMGEVNVSDHDHAVKVIDLIPNAIETVSRYRIQFGAQQNRLEHGMAIDENIAENTQAAEGRIRDLDMADEMVVHSKKIF